MLHPVWTKLSLLRSEPDPEEASRKIRGHLRRRILGLSAFSVNEPLEMRQIRDRHRQIVAEAERAKLHQEADWKQLALDYAAENDLLHERLDNSQSEISDLKVQLANLQEALQWKQEPEAVEPENDIPPNTVAEAVHRAKTNFSHLRFGKDVDRGLEALSPDAGPPEKILQYLASLDELAIAQMSGPLGVSQIQWLNSRGVHASGESETVKNSEKDMRKRTWDGKRFETHLKPSDGVSPDRCVRIYFDYDHESRSVDVGWIGRHPD